MEVSTTKKPIVLTISFLFSAVVLLFVSLASNATQLKLIPYWYVDTPPIEGNRMYRQAVYPKIYSSVLGGGFTESNLDSYTQSARSKWVSGGMPSDYVTNIQGSTVKIYGGPRSYLEAINSKITVPIDGNLPTALTAYTSFYNEGQWGYDPNGTGSWGYGIQYIDGYRSFNNTIVVPYNSDVSSTINTMIITHELGHVFGWYGHSDRSGDMMQANVNGSLTLTSRDINHVKQIHDRVGYNYSVN